MKETVIKKEIKLCKTCGMQTNHEVEYRPFWGDKALKKEFFVKGRCLSPQHKISNGYKK